MSFFRTLNRLPAWVFAWFVLCYGVAYASPIVQPRSLELVCAKTGMLLISHNTDGLPDMAKPGLDCPLCLLGQASAPPPPAWAAQPPPLCSSLALALPPARPLVLAPSGAPPPARAPPVSLCQS